MAARVLLPPDPALPMAPIRLRHLFRLPAPWRPLPRAWEARLLQVLLWLFVAGLGVGAFVSFGAVLSPQPGASFAVVPGSLFVSLFVVASRSLVFGSCEAPLRFVGGAPAGDAHLTLTRALTETEARQAEEAFARDLALVLAEEAPGMLGNGHMLHIGIAFVAPSAFAPVHALVLAGPSHLAPSVLPLDTPRRQRAFEIHIAAAGRSGHAWIQRTLSGRNPRGSAVIMAQADVPGRAYVCTEAVSIADLSAHERRRRLRQLDRR
mgnify:CR=1 FL=1